MCKTAPKLFFRLILSVRFYYKIYQKPVLFNFFTLRRIRLSYYCALISALCLYPPTSRSTLLKF